MLYRGHVCSWACVKDEAPILKPRSKVKVKSRSFLIAGWFCNRHTPRLLLFLAYRAHPSDRPRDPVPTLERVLEPSRGTDGCQDLLVFEQYIDNYSLHVDLFRLTIQYLTEP